MGDATEVAGGVAERARREADAYRGDNPRPLAGYLVVLGIYGTLVAVTAVLAAATGRSLPKRWGIQDLVTVTLGTHKLSRALSKDAVTSPLRAPLPRWPVPTSCSWLVPGHSRLPGADKTRRFDAEDDQRWQGVVEERVAEHAAAFQCQSATDVRQGACFGGQRVRQRAAGAPGRLLGPQAQLRESR